MSKYRDDLGKIGDVLLNFFGTKRIRETLNAIYERDVTGWEKWWQIELSLYLANAKTIAEWDMEHPFETDRRSNHGRNHMTLDIGFRLKNHTKDEWYFVELKQVNDYRKCIAGMCKDAKKVFSAKKKSLDGLAVRYIACAGIFIASDENDVLGYAEDVLDRLDIDHEGFYLENIGKHYSLLIL